MTPTVFPCGSRNHPTVISAAVTYGAGTSTGAPHSSAHVRYACGPSTSTYTSTVGSADGVRAADGVPDAA